MAAKFHGIAPGKKAQEKRLNQFKAEQAAKSRETSTNQTMSSLLTAQQVMGSAGVAVNGGQIAGNNAAVSAEQIRAIAREKLAKRAQALKKKQQT